MLYQMISICMLISCSYQLYQGCIGLVSERMGEGAYRECIECVCAVYRDNVVYGSVSDIWIHKYIVIHVSVEYVKIRIVTILIPNAYLGVKVH